MEKIITVTKGEVKYKEDDKWWVELTDQDGKLHRCFTGAKKPDGDWLDITDKIIQLYDASTSKK